MFGGGTTRRAKECSTRLYVRLAYNVRYVLFDLLFFFPLSAFIELHLQP